jgi:hypothetical protein
MTRNRPGRTERREVRELENLLLEGKTDQAVAVARQLKADRERRAAEFSQGQAKRRSGIIG